jgi:integrase
VGRRDALLMRILLEEGQRISEVVLLTDRDFALVTANCASITPRWTGSSA